MKRLVYVAYFFPPTGGAGVQRSLKFVRHLPRLGWTTTVVTVRESRYWMQDPTLLAEVPDDVAVIRTESRTAPDIIESLLGGRGPRDAVARRSGASRRALRRLSGFFFLPDPYVGWVSAATREAARALEGGGVLLTTSSPDSAHLVGVRLSGQRVPWVADFRDPWVRRMSFNPPTPVHRRLQMRLEARVVHAADRVVVTSEQTRADYLGRYPDLDPAKVVCITNGYDEEDFPRDDPPPDPSFLIAHMGQLNPERPVRPVLDHLQAFFALRPEARALSRLELIGARYREDEIEVARRGLGETVRFIETLPHREAICRLLTARVLLLHEQESERGGLILPGKVFEYLRAGRPILGLVPAGAAWELITRLGAGCCALPSDPEGGGAHLARLFDSYRAGDPLARTDRQAIAPYERRALAGRLSELLEEVLREKPSA